MAIMPGVLQLLNPSTNCFFNSGVIKCMYCYPMFPQCSLTSQLQDHGYNTDFFLFAPPSVCGVIWLTNLSINYWPQFKAELNHSPALS